MQQETAEILTSFGGEVHEDYSGRGMFGKTTTAAVFDSEREFYNSLADVISECVEDQNMTDADLITDMLRNLQTDSMGTGIIIY